MTNLDDILNELPTAQKQESLGSVLDSLPVSSTFKNNTSVGSLRKIEADQEQSEKERANLVASLPGADPYYGHGVKGVPYRDPSIVDNSQNGINSIVSAAQQYKANIEKVLGELQQANKNADESRTIPYLPGADPFYAHYQKNLPYQDPNIRTPEQAAAAYQVTKEIIGKPAGNIAITPFVPAPIRGVAGAAFLPFLVNDIADTYNKNNQPNNLKRVLNGEDLPENLPSSSGVLTKTANEAVVQPVIDPIKRAVSNPNEFIRNIADDPTKLWSDVFLPYAVVGHPAKSVLEKTSNGLAKVLDELPRAKEELGKNLDANSQPSNDLYIAIVKQESNGNYEAVNKDSGARGNIQWMPETWASEAERVLGDKNAPMTPANQEVVGRAYIQRLSEELQDPKLVAAAIYAGEGYAQSLAKGKPLFDPNIRFDEKGNLDPNGKYPSVSEYINQVLSKTGDNGFSPQGLNRFSFEETPGSPFKITDVKDESETLQKKDITLDEAIKQGDYEIAATLAEEMGSKIYAERFRRMAAGQNKAAMVAPEDTKTAIDGGLRFNKDNSLLQKPDAVVSRIKGDEIPLGNTFEEARKNARDWAIENVRGAYENRDLGLIDVPSNGIRHTINSARELEHLKAVAALPDLIRNAVKVDTRADYRGRPDIRNVHTLYAPLDIGGKSYISKIVVNETKDGHKFYDHQASEIKELGGDNRGPQSNKGQLGVSPAPSSTNMSISDLLQNVKEEHKPSAIREQSNGKEFMAANGMTVPKNSMPPELPSGETVKDTISRRDIVNKVNELFTKVSTGRLGVRGVLGWFDRDSEVIRTKDYADFRAIMHEIGHYLDKGLNLRKESNYDNELVSAVNRRFGEAYNHLSPEQIRGEGIAEFIHDYTINPERAQREFPEYYKAFTQRLAQEPQIRSKLEDVSKRLRTWYNQAAEERVKGSISFGDSRYNVEKAFDAVKNPKETAEVIVRKSSNLFEKGYDNLVDQLAPIGRMMKEIQKITGEKIPLALDVFKQAWLTRGWAGKAQALIEHGMPSQGVPALKAIIKNVERDYKGFSAYVTALRELDDYAIEDRTGKNFNHAMSRDDSARTVIEGRKRPEFVKAQKDLVIFQSHLLDILVDAGLKDRYTVELWKKERPNYSPLYRDFSKEAAVEKFLSTRGYGNVPNPTKKFKGDSRDPLAPIESIIKNTYQFINLAERNKVGRLFVDLAQHPGLGKLIEKVPGSASSRDSTFSVWNNGRKEVYQTTPELYRAIMLLDREPAQGIMKILSIPAGWLRAGAVLSPEFIVRNPVRDAWSAFVYSKYGFIPGIDTARGLMHFLKKDDLYWEYMDSGAAHAAMVSLDRDYLAQNIREIMAKPAYMKAASVVNPKTYIDILRAFSEATEIATRLGEYENARKGYSGVLNRLFSDKRDQVSIQEAALGARDVTLDFSRSGSWGKEANKYIAFWNAAIQGTDKMVRAFKDNPVQTSSKVFLSVTLPSIVLWYMNKDDQRYQELPQWQKDLFWIIPTKDTLIKIPKPFEVGILFGTSVERMLQWAHDKDNKGNAFKGFGNTVFDAMLPGWVPTAVLPVIEWTTNYSLFMDRNIVPQSQAKLPPKLQYGPNTSAIGKYVGEKFNVSPSKVDNTIRGYTGGLGGLAMTASDLVSGAFDNRPTMRVSEYPGIRAFTATHYKSSQSVQEFYDKLQQQEQYFNEFKQTNAKPEGFNPSEYQRLKTVERLMTQVHQQGKSILANNKMSSDEKRNRLDQLNVLAVNYARLGLGKKERVKQ